MESVGGVGGVNHRNTCQIGEGWVFHLKNWDCNLRKGQCRDWSGSNLIEQLQTHLSIGIYKFLRCYTPLHTPLKSCVHSEFLIDRVF